MKGQPTIFLTVSPLLRLFFLLLLNDLLVPAQPSTLTKGTQSFNLHDRLPKQPLRQDSRVLQCLAGLLQRGGLLRPLSPRLLRGRTTGNVEDDVVDGGPRSGEEDGGGGRPSSTSEEHSQREGGSRQISSGAGAAQAISSAEIGQDGFCNDSVPPGWVGVEPPHPMSRGPHPISGMMPVMMMAPDGTPFGAQAAIMMPAFMAMVPAGSGGMVPTICPAQFWPPQQGGFYAMQQGMPGGPYQSGAVGGISGVPSTLPPAHPRCPAPGVSSRLPPVQQSGCGSSGRSGCGSSGRH